MEQAEGDNKTWVTGLKEGDTLIVPGPCEIRVKRITTFEVKVSFLIDRETVILKNMDPESYGNK